MVTTEEFLATIAGTQAWRFAGLVQDRLMRPVGEKAIINPADGTPGSYDCGVFTFAAPDGTYIRALNGVERACETWIEASKDKGKTWNRLVTLTREDETINDRKLASVEHPYIYSKTVNGKPWIVLGMSASEKDTKCWDIRERSAPLEQLEQLKTAPLRPVLSGNAEYAYKDGTPIQSPDGQGVYLAATRHHIYGPPETGVNADTVLCRLDEAAGRYEVVNEMTARYARGGLDKTCNRINSELVLPDGSRFWGCDVRNVEAHNAAAKAVNPPKPGDHRNWILGNFDEITSCALGTWTAGDAFPVVVSVDAILGWSAHARYPALRYLGVARLSWDNADAIWLTYERAGETGNKTAYQQAISRKDLTIALEGKGPQLILEQDPLQEVRRRLRM